MPRLSDRDDFIENLMKIEVKEFNQDVKKDYRVEDSLWGTPWCFSNVEAVAQTKA